MSERDDERAGLYDAADDAAQEATFHQDMLNRERQAEEALDECKRLGVSVEHLRTLARETGATHWALVNSLKGAK